MKGLKSTAKTIQNTLIAPSKYDDEVLKSLALASTIALVVFAITAGVLKKNHWEGGEVAHSVLSGLAVAFALLTVVFGGALACKEVEYHQKHSEHGHQTVDECLVCDISEALRL